MKAAEAAALLTICAAYDNRKPDADQARAWALVLDGQRFEDCREAIVNHYRTSREWLMPVNIIDGVQQIRLKRLEDFQKRIRLEPPAHLADDPANEIAWFNSIYRRVMDGEVVDPNEVDSRGELKPRDIAELGQVGREMPRAFTQRTTKSATNDTPANATAAAGTENDERQAS